MQLDDANESWFKLARLHARDMSEIGVEGHRDRTEWAVLLIAEEAPRGDVNKRDACFNSAHKLCVGILGEMQKHGDLFRSDTQTSLAQLAQLLQILIQLR